MELVEGRRGPGSSQKTLTVHSGCCLVRSFLVAGTSDKVDQISSVDLGRFFLDARRKDSPET